MLKTEPASPVGSLHLRGLPRLDDTVGPVLFPLLDIRGSAPEGGGDTRSHAPPLLRKPNPG